MNCCRIFLFFLLGLLGTAAADELFQPPRDTPLQEIPAKEARSPLTEQGEMALEIHPEKWKTAETPHFYIHFRRFTEAKKVAREIEFDFAFVAHQLGINLANYPTKSHVFVFEDVSEWAAFSSKVGFPEWSGSVAVGDDLFLNVREKEGFDSQTLAHETTHATVSRVYKSQRWPVWLNEGFAEYMGSAAVAGRKNGLIRRYEKALSTADMPLNELTELKSYPSDSFQVQRLYQTGEKFVRFLMEKGKPTQFVSFVDALLDGKSVSEAILGNYGAAFPDYATFEKEFSSYQRVRH